MKKYIIILNAIEVLKMLLSGKMVEGSLFIDKTTHKLTFKAYNRKSENHQKLPETLIRKTPYGRVTKTLTRIKQYISIPINMPFLEKMDTFDEENRLAKEALIDYELINRV